MMRWTTGALTLSLAMVACGGKYDVGTMDPHGGGGTTSPASSGSASVGASDVGASPSLGLGGSSSAGLGGGSSVGPSMPTTDELGPQCVASGEPPPLTGQFAEPAVVWNRISMLAWGEPMGPMPFALPATTTYDWAGNMVTFALLDVKNTTDGSRGLETILRQWFELAPDATFQGPWADALLADEPALDVLLLTQFFQAERLGIFSEPSWLAQHSSISTRGAVIQSALLGQPVPSPPAGSLPMMLMPGQNVSDREALAAATANPVCSSCHQLCDPPGVALGHFDAKGAFRELDHDQPIDAASSLLLANGGLSVAFDGLQDFNHKLADSCAANKGFADAFLRLALAINGGPSAAQENLVDASAQRVRQAFVNGGRSYEALVKAYIQSPAGLYP
jgi:Protein of unknown function (DUF1588)